MGEERRAKELRERALEDYNVENPEIRKIGLPRFISNCFTQDVYALSPKEVELKQMYRRGIRVSHAKAI